MAGQSPIAYLVHQLAKLPGIGERSASRLAFHILQAPTSYASQLAQAIIDVRQKLRQCTVCCMLTEHDPCAICSNHKRDTTTIMVVALPQDLLAIERSGGYHGQYHVLHGLLSPLDGIGPDALRIRELLARCSTDTESLEIILATNPTVEGDTTAMYLAKLLKPLDIHVSRIASGVPIGGELEYADGVTLDRAISNRHTI